MYQIIAFFEHKSTVIYTQLCYTRNMKKETPKPEAKKAPITFPMRLNRYLSLDGKSSRRSADKMIEHKWIKINGRFAVLGDKVNEGDKVEILKTKTHFKR